MHTVLIADDEHIELAFLRSVIEAPPNPYRVIAEAANGERALALATSLQPDVVILDINMPTMSGLEAAKEVKRLSPGTVVVLNSAYAEFDFARQAIDYDVDAYLVKPADAALILSTLEGCLEKRSLGHRPGATLGFAPGCTYPYELTDRLLEGLSRRDACMVESAAMAYLKFFRNQRSHHEHYQLFILNTLFSIRRQLQKSDISPSLLQLLGDNLYLEQIGRAGSWYELLLHLEEYFSRLRLLLEGCDCGERGFTSQVALFIDQHYAEPITLDQLAQLVHLSPAYLSRRFHQEQGLPIRDYIAKKRMEQARYLLQTSRLSIKEAAQCCGFSNLSYFYKICKEQTGLSPAQLRQEASEGEAQIRCK